LGILGKIISVFIKLDLFYTIKLIYLLLSEDPSPNLKILSLSFIVGHTALALS
jgi:hypothetical protein